MEPMLLIVFAFVILVVIAQNRSRERREKLRILEQALRSGHLDEATKAELVGELTGRRPAQHAGAVVRRSRPTRILFALGWLAFFVGAALTAVDAISPFENGLMLPGIIVAGCGFAAMSLPIAVREFERSQAAREPGR
ncbi:MAG: hypothetical protein IPM29_07330 [Planctomycetes bacterium]|nr:hypothetical protein [Planctomycetota bacterium]